MKLTTNLSLGPRLKMHSVLSSLLHMPHGIGTTVLLKENCYRSTDIHDPASRLIKADQGEKKELNFDLHFHLNLL